MKPTWNKLAFFTALCFFFSAMELAVPKPVPFFRLGLANIPIMLSFEILTPAQTLLLILLKIFVQGIVSGTMFSYIFIFSFCGSFASGISMLLIYHLLKKRNLISWIGVSLTGGFFNNISQILLASFFIFGSNTKYIAPVLLSITLISSTILGIWTNWLWEKSPLINKLKNDELNVSENLSNENKNSDESKFKFPPLISACFLILTFFSNDLKIIYGTIALFLLLNILSKNKLKILPSLSIIFFVTLFNIFSPEGKVIFTLWKLKITRGALIFGLVKSGKLCACVFISKMIISRIKFNKGKTGEFINLIFCYLDEINRNYKVFFARK